ncbi:MAG: LamG domain-containing protein [Candidatus Poribacteria bacterium]|nr:LamG domain-containing protein [Candidatus Poribacteria bacterium]
MRRLTIFLSCMIVSVTLSLQVFANTFITDGLVSYWTFDRKDIRNNEIKDVWGNNDGKSDGNPKIISGHIGEALQFDGTDDYVNLTNLGDFGSQLGSSTFEAWIIVDQKNDPMTLFKIQDGCILWGFIINNVMKGTNDNLQHIISHKVGNGCHSYSMGLKPIKFSDGKWHHFVITIDIVIGDAPAKEKKLQSRFYRDGKLFSSLALPLRQPGTFVPFVKSFYLGSEGKHGNQTRFFKGAIDEVRIYNRTLTETEVIQNFESRIGYSVEPNNKLPITWGFLKTSF